MAKVKIPDPLARRHLLESETDAATAKKLASAYLEAGRETEAIEFLRRAEDRETLSALQTSAVTCGDVFLMKAASGALGDEPSRARWTELAEAARAAGRVRDAEAAMRIASVDG